MDEQRGGGDLMLMAFGAILVAGAMQQSTNAAAARARVDVLSRLGLIRRRWRRRGSTASTTLELAAGVGLIVYALVRTARSAGATAPTDEAPTDTRAPPTDRFQPATVA